MKYIFVAAPPGSLFWSRTISYIYHCLGIDTSDTDYRSVFGSLWLPQLESNGSYGQLGTGFDNLDQLTKEECENNFDLPFKVGSTGTRIIKSHLFCYHIDFLKNTWPDCKIIAQYRPLPDALIAWLSSSPSETFTVNAYYNSLGKTMHDEIYNQTSAMLSSESLKDNSFDVTDVVDLGSRLGLTVDLTNPIPYSSDNIKVAVI